MIMRFFGEVRGDGEYPAAIKNFKIINLNI